MLNPQWLRTFGMLVELGNFTRAAEALGLTQAAVSQHLRHLEQEIGVLVIRRPRRIELTPAGKALLEYCAEIQLADRRLGLRLSESDGETGEVSLISPGSIGLALYPLLLDLQQSHPGWVVRHRFGPAPEVLDAVLQNQYELGLVTLRPDDPRLSAEPFAEEALELVVPATARVAGWDDLARLGFIDHPDGQAMASRLLSRYYPANPGIRSMPRRGFSNQVGLILEPVARGLGFTVIPQFARQAFARPGEIAVVEVGPAIVDKLWLIHRAEWPPSRGATRAVAYLRERMGALTAPP